MTGCWPGCRGGVDNIEKHCIITGGVGSIGLVLADITTMRAEAIAEKLVP